MRRGEPRGARDGGERRRIRLVHADVVAVVRATAHEAVTDDVEGEAAKMAFYFFLSLFPLVLIVFALTGIVGGDEAFGRIVAVAHGVVPRHAWQVVEDLLREITHRERPGV